MGMLLLVGKNLTRSRLRTLFTLASVIIAFMLFALLGGLNRAFTAGVELAGADRLITLHRVSFIQPLPLSYVQRVRQIDGVVEATHQTWFGAYFQDPRSQFGLFPTEVEELRRIYPEFDVPDDQWQAMLDNRTGLMVGRAMAESFGWEVGDRVPLFSSIFPRQDGNFSWPFVVEAIFTGSGNAADEQQAYMHYDYFNESRQFGRDTVGWMIAQIDDPDRADAVAEAIDRRFANSPTETKTSTEAGFAAGFANQFGNIGLIVQLIMGCVFFTLLLITGNTMAQAVRERTGELAVLKTIGFSDRRILGLVLAESLAVAIIGGAIGLALGSLAVQGAASVMAQFFPGLAPSVGALGWGLALAVVLGLVTGALPAWQAARLKVVDAMGRR
ncbi:ABC transporter permease [Wenzhouxiangella sp. XN79A]|uniref:ABC transporter permease n=1 Tax=Wenzhouxiangella sp. XN79A TaxID=2724193 RepID=UPI00144AA9A8|nr:FtsX-like permease family protein [Wenzhouxiangella sp. XN79A]NKI36210.1 ABC transporter permease [Wenzhouxiangella sp. XN79A]